MVVLMLLAGCRGAKPSVGQSGVAASPSEQLFPIKQHGKWGYMNAQGKIIISPRFNEADEFSEGLAYADQTFIDTTGKSVINLMPVLQRQIAVEHQFSGGVVLLSDIGHHGFVQNLGGPGVLAQVAGGASGYALMNHQGDVVVPPYPLIMPFAGGLAPVRLNGGIAMVNTAGQIAVPAGNYWSVPECGEGLCAVASIVDPDHRWGYIDTQGKAVIAPQFHWAHGFVEGRARVWIIDQPPRAWGFIDKTGSVVIANEYDAEDDFSDGMAAVKKNARWGFIDPGGRIAVDFVYPDPPGRFHGGLARVTLDGKMTYIDKQGRSVWTSTE
jgi:hypothetical protein